MPVYRAGPKRPTERVSVISVVCTADGRRVGDDRALHAGTAARWTASLRKIAGRSLRPRSTSPQRDANCPRISSVLECAALFLCLGLEQS